MEAMQKLVECVCDVVTGNLKSSWKQDLILACDAVELEYDLLQESVKDLLDLTEYKDVDSVVWDLVNKGDEWTISVLNRAQGLLDNGAASAAAVGTRTGAVASADIEKGGE